jgi:WD40 repeat protein
MKVSTKQRKDKPFYEFDALSLAQSLHVDKQIWTLKFSYDGRFLAGGGEQGLLVIWDCSPANLNQLLVLRQTLAFHSNSVIDLSWSVHMPQLLSAGLDKSAVLWSVDSLEPVATYPHPDIVSCVSFYAHSPNFFITGSFDKFVRLWNITHKRVEAYWQLSDFITSGCFSPAHDLLLVGMLHGQVNVYRCELPELRLISSLECRNRAGLKKKGRKVTGLEFYDDSHFLVTTNDSNLRLYSLEDFSMVQKYKGLTNESLPIKAAFSHNWQHLVCGSDSGHVFIWNVFAEHHSLLSHKPTRNQSYECFMPSRSKTVTATAFAPDRLLREVQESGVLLKVAVGHVLVTADSSLALQIFVNAYRLAEI